MRAVRGADATAKLVGDLRPGASRARRRAVLAISRLAGAVVPANRDLICTQCCRGPVRTFPVTAFGRSRPAADASREVVECWLLDGLR